MLMRVACPALMLAAIATGVFAWFHGNFVAAGINAALAALNLYLSYVQWFRFRLHPTSK